jgi:hypothetical protein
MGQTLPESTLLSLQTETLRSNFPMINSVDIDPMPTRLKWKHFAMWRHFRAVAKGPEVAKNEFLQFTSELEKLTGSEAERIFFRRSAMGQNIFMLPQNGA